MNNLYIYCHMCRLYGYFFVATGPEMANRESFNPVLYFTVFKKRWFAMSPLYYRVMLKGVRIPCTVR